MTPQDQRRFFANENGDPLHAAFDKKSAVHPGARGRPLDPERIGEVWSQIMAREGKREKVAERLDYINSLGQTAMVIDLIYGFPYQTMEIWEKDVTKYIELKLNPTFVQNVHKIGCCLFPRTFLMEQAPSV